MEDEMTEADWIQDHDWDCKRSLQIMTGAIDSHKKIVRDEESALIKKAKGRYEANSLKKVGDICCCPSCGKDFKKKSYQQKFHRKKCKDIYWNSVNPIRRERATLFSSLKPKYK